ncbi:carboxymuconolactone decarboxylase family protein [Mycobacterium montefiorense]|uniref:Carboxymuconolactone decarboxylase n=1 Tax=Mycobacterium montefiorense TaxID=154654 RepID=A0AA37PLZ9_9MYCO|nr:carboxymuconolactone decarboxylase family protein [Mycobacterium montefiorense]GBG35866.1 carboxymuconolactone decarboxylase [Mycobacterium montefiorense]GKU35370.1 carboxymuconolactone decarboxylase [Mycobacterium montefiorense]GKU40371.1 carboxymuconolactone decarboxylase [Mycobacterium montefiorense]GKU45749.1 carboxymuconolactone decarboxylase [Mycobacterium montefiorense]GKU50105.1 carboxymuconolactone decarboxylase [Mycobacterium montefiorense]
MTDQHSPRLAPLPADEWDDRSRRAIASLIPVERANPMGAGNILSTLVRHPDLTRAYLPFNTYLLNGSTLSARVREVALLRVVHRRGCDYLWSHHLPIAQRAGLSAEEIDAIRDGQLADDSDQSVLSTVDDLIDEGTICTPTWRELGRHFADDQRMDLVFTVGGYCLLAMAVNAFGIEDEEL